MSDTHVVILAAGKGTRMKSADPKVLHRAAGFSLIEHVLRAADALAPATTVVVVGHMADRVQDALGKRLGLRFALQEPQLGTGHALLQAEPHLAGAVRHGGAAVGRRAAVASRRRCGRSSRRTPRGGAAATVLTARVDRPQGYGRIVREDGRHRRDRRGQGRDAGGARDRRDQQRHLRLRAGAAVRGAEDRSAPRTRRGSTTCRIW